MKKKFDESGDQSAGQNTLPKDRVFDLLSSRRRRDVLEYLAERGPNTTLNELAEYIAAKENDTEKRLLSSQQRKRVYVALYQCHLPRMSDSDVIDYDRDRGTVERGRNADQLYRFMEVRPKTADGRETEDGGSIVGGLNALRSKLDEFGPTSK